MYLYIDGTNNKVIESYLDLLGEDAKHPGQYTDSVKLIALLEEAYDNSELDLDYFPFGVYDVEFISTTEAILIHESHWSSKEETRVQLKD